MEKESISKGKDFFSFEMPPARHIQQIINAGNRSPFISHFHSIFLSRRAPDNLMNAPLEFIICADVYRIVRIFEKKGKGDLLDIKSLFLIALQNGHYAANNIVSQAQTLELYVKYTAMSYERAKVVIQDWNLPQRVVPFLTLSVGYPEFEPPTPVPFPIEFVVFEDEYPAANDFLVDELMFHLDQEDELVEYYKKVEQTGASDSEKRNWSWFDILEKSMAAWEASLPEFMKIVKLCGINF